MGKGYMLRVRMDEGTYYLLEELREMLGLPTLSETVRVLIVVFHVLAKVGIHRILKPVPELAQLVMSEWRSPPRASGRASRKSP